MIHPMYTGSWLRHTRLVHIGINGVIWPMNNNADPFISNLVNLKAYPLLLC